MPGAPLGPEGKSPRLSVVVAAKLGAGLARACLEALARQPDRSTMEIILVDGSPDGVGEASGASRPDQHLRLSADTPLPRLWAEGIGRSRGDIVAITETTCIVGEGWSAEVLRAHREPHAAIGGAVEPRGLAGPVSWAAYFVDYGQFMEPFPAGPAAELPGINVSFKRWALEECGSGDQEFWKTFCCWRLAAGGHTLFLTPRIVVYYARGFTLGEFVRRRYHHARCFAVRWVQFQRAGLRLARAALAPVLPALLLGRVARRVLPKGRFRREFLGALPVTVLAACTWSWGELCGFLLGPGQSCRQVH